MRGAGGTPLKLNEREGLTRGAPSQLTSLDSRAPVYKSGGVPPELKGREGLKGPRLANRPLPRAGPRGEGRPLKSKRTGPGG